MEEKDITSTFLMKQILDELSHLKTNMPNGELKHLQTSMEDLKKDQRSMKDDISDMKKKLLDPESGVIVKVNENTKFRLAEENRYEDYMKVNIDVDSLKKWQSGVNKALWIIFGAILAIALKVIFGVAP
jgi:phosphoribosylformylglycinamidine (FGAM) synthase PurS component